MTTPPMRTEPPSSSPWITWHDEDHRLASSLLDPGLDFWDMANQGSRSQVACGDEDVEQYLGRRELG
jgi:hypothetical protein